MLKAHFDAREKTLIAQAGIQANAGHSLHKGTPREVFVREFLQGHLSARLAIGTGEIIDAASQPGAARNQFDVVIYKSDYPKIDLGGGISAFLSESVVATVEIKSVLDAAGIAQAVGAASKAKRLSRNLITAMTSGFVPSGILSYVVAYDGPSNVSTIAGWLKANEAALGLNTPPPPTTRVARHGVVSESLDGVFVLGRGMILYDNMPMTLVTDQLLATNPLIRYQAADQADGNLLLLFMALTMAGSNAVSQWADFGAYIGNLRMTAQFY